MYFTPWISLLLHKSVGFFQSAPAQSLLRSWPTSVLSKAAKPNLRHRREKNLTGEPEILLKHWNSKLSKGRELTNHMLSGCKFENLACLKILHGNQLISGGSMIESKSSAASGA